MVDFAEIFEFEDNPTRPSGLMSGIHLIWKLEHIWSMDGPGWVSAIWPRKFFVVWSVHLILNLICLGVRGAYPLFFT